MLNKRELSAIRKALPDNGYALVSEKIGVSKETVRKVLSEPNRFNALVIETAFEVIEESKQRVSVIKEKVKSI